MTITVIFVYLAIVLAVGTLSHKLFRGTGEDYFVASRSFGPFLLLMSLFGANMTAFAILGASGEAYHTGIGVFALMASSSALVIPAVFYFIGTRLWSLGKRLNYLTQIQYFRQRYDSDFLGLVLFFIISALMIPYILVGFMGSGITLSQITNGQLPEWLGGLIVCVVTLAYVTYGGMRGTVWVNTFQVLIFMTFGLAAFVVVFNKFGGVGEGMALVAQKHPDLLIRGEHITPLQLLSYTCIPLSVGMFPHMFLHWLTAKRADTFRKMLVFYPLCIAIVWLPSVLLGVLGVVDFPNLKGAGANSVLARMIELYAPGALAGFLAAGVLSAIMNSVDSQTLAIGTMFTQDIVRHYGFHDKMNEKQQVLFGRLFIVLIIVATYLLSLVVDRSIFRISVWTFTGFAAMFPVVVAALFWKRSTKYGALAAVLSVVVLWLYCFANNIEDVGGGTMPVALILGVAAAAMIVVSLLTRPPSKAVLEKFFPSDRKIAADQVSRAGDRVVMK
jgi:SSS family solute:Na+ symporter